jgi:EAL domain-containing protein (putative c-di-GMP-specific phosphodiesterase class I)
MSPFRSDDGSNQNVRLAARAEGAKIALDDLGSGYSSVSVPTRANFISREAQIF